MTDDLVPDARVRISLAERDAAVRILREATADGRLEFEELEQRTPRALEARTRGELAEVLGDLLPASDLEGLFGTAPALGEGPGHSWEDPLVIRHTGWWRPLKMEGEWEVPPFIEILTQWGAVKLDFTHARVLAPVVDVTLVVGWGATITLVVPQGWGVDASDVRSNYVTTSLPTRPRKGMPRIVLRGRADAGVKVKEAPAASQASRSQASRELTR